MLVGVPPNPLALLATMKPLTKSPIRTYLGWVPDHSPVSQLRWRKPSFGKSFRRLFEEIVRQCVPNGPVTGRLVGTDLCEGQCLQCLGGADGATGEPRELLRPSGHQRGGWAGGTGKHRSKRTKQLKKDSCHTRKRVCHTDPEDGHLNRPGRPRGAHYLGRQTVDTDHGVIIGVTGLTVLFMRAKKSFEWRTCKSVSKGLSWWGSVSGIGAPLELGAA